VELSQLCAFGGMQAIGTAEQMIQASWRTAA
jgi:hypothetical protein